MKSTTENNLPTRRTQKDLEEEAKRVIKSKFVPEHFSDDLPSLQYTLGIGESLGLDTPASLMHIYGFTDSKGRLQVALSSHLIVALARKAGHDVHVEGNGTEATGTLVRGDITPSKIERFSILRKEMQSYVEFQQESAEKEYDFLRKRILNQIRDLKEIAEISGTKPDPATIETLQRQLKELHSKDFSAPDLSGLDPKKLGYFTNKWTIQRAQAAGLTEKKGDMWTKFRPDMLKRRASSGVVRDGAVEVLIGVRSRLREMGFDVSEAPIGDLQYESLYTPEEKGVEVGDDGQPLETSVYDVSRDDVPELEVEQALARLDKYSLQDLTSIIVKTWSKATGKNRENGLEKIKALHEASRRKNILDEEVKVPNRNSLTWGAFLEEFRDRLILKV